LGVRSDNGLKVEGGEWSKEARPGQVAVLKEALRRRAGLSCYLEPESLCIHLVIRLAGGVAEFG